MNASRFLVALGVILCLVLSPVTALMPADTAQAQPANSAWPMFGQNPQRTGRSPYSGPEVPGLKWTFTTGAAIRSSPAIGTDGTIYVGADDNKLYAINPDGGQRWSFTTGDYVDSSPAIGADGTIYVGSNDNKLYAINPDGSQKWSFTTGGPIRSSPAIGADGTIYVGSDDNNLYAINPDGSQKWSFTTGDSVLSSPAIGADGTIYIGSDDMRLYAVNPDGSQKWSFTTGDYVVSSPAIGADGTIYVGSNDNRLYAINRDGSQKWSFTTGDSVLSSPAIGADGTIYIGSDDMRLYAVNPDGSQNWSFMTGEPRFSPVRSSPAIAADGTIYVGSLRYYDNLLALNPDGGQKWSFSTGGHIIESSPAIGADGTIYVGSGRLYAVTEGEEHELTISTTAGGSVIVPGEGTFTYAEGTRVYLVAEADEGYRFVNWTGDVETIDDVKDATTFITAEGDYYIIAHFAEIQIAIKAGDWIKFERTTTALPAGEPYPEWMKLEFVSVEGTTVTILVTVRMSDGTEESDAGPVDLAGGDDSELGGLVIPANLTKGDSVYVAGSEGLTIEGETTRTYAGAARTILYTSFSRYGDQLTFCWDKLTGVLVELSGPYDDSTLFVLKATETNIWGATTGGCFIATAAYGTPMAEEIGILREFKDDFLLTSPLGQALVGVYYRVSPPVAEFITKHSNLKSMVRAGLLPAVAMSTIAVNTSPVEKIAVVGLLVLVSGGVGAWATKRRGRGRDYA